jgi:sulfur-oxidizing protein SoxY
MRQHEESKSQQMNVTDHAEAEAPDAGRRRFLIAGAGFAGLAALPLIATREAAATPAAMAAAIREVIGEAPVRTGRVQLEVPPIVENGNTVPMMVAVDSPMTAEDHVKAIHVFNEKNPQPYVASFRLGPRAGRARVSTRIRLADSQQVVAIAELSDGSLWQASTDVIVTIAACVERVP